MSTCQLTVFICSKKWFLVDIIVLSLVPKDKKSWPLPSRNSWLWRAGSHINNDHSVPRGSMGFLESHMESEQQACATVALGLGKSLRSPSRWRYVS